MWLRRILLSLGVFCALIAICMTVGVFVLNSQWFLHFAESKATEYVGRKVTIGSFELDFGRISRLRVQDLSIANPSWASDPSLATVDMLAMKVRVLPLLKGDLQITDLQATTPVVHLERSGQGQANWTFTPAGSAGDSRSIQQPSGESASFDLPRIETMAIDGGRLTYVDSQQDISLGLSFHAGWPESDPEQGRLVAEGGGHVAGEPVTIGLSAGAGSPQTPSTEDLIQVGLKIKTVQTIVAIEGTVDALLSPEAANLHFRLEGHNLSRWNEILAIQLPAFPGYQLTGTLLLADKIWSIDPMNIIVADSDLGGSIRVMSGANPIRIEGSLHSTRLNVAQLQGYMPQQQEADSWAVQVGNLLEAIAHTGWQSSLNYRADVIVTEAYPVHRVNIAMGLQDERLTIESLTGDVGGAHLTLETQLSVTEKLAEGHVFLQAENIQSTERTTEDMAPDQGPNATESFPGKLSVELAMNIHPIRRSDQKSVSQQSSARPDAIQSVDWSTLDIKNFDIRYDAPSLQTHVQAQIDENSQERLLLQVSGKYRNEPIDMTVTAPSLDSFSASSPDGASRKRLTAHLELAGATASVAAMIQPLWPPMWIDLSFAVNSESPSTLAAVMGVAIPALGKMALKGSLSKRTHIWSLKTFSAHLDESDISGQATIDTAEDFRVRGKFQSDMLNVASLIPATTKATAGTSTPESSEQDSDRGGSRNRLLPSWLNNLEGILGLQVKQVVVPGATLKDVTVRATIDDGLLRIAPLTVHLGGGTVKTTAQLDLRNPALSAHLQTDIQRVDVNKTMQALGREGGVQGQVSGRLALSLPPSPQNTEPPRDARALMERLRIDDIRLRYDDPELQARTDLRLNADSFTSGIQITGRVEYRDNPIDVSLSTGSFRQAFQDYGSMPVDATFNIRETTIQVDGKVGELFPVEKFKGTVRMEGPDPARLGDAIGIPLPHLPPYRLEALVHREQGAEKQQTFNLTNLNGTIGDSDIAGTLRVTTGAERPILFARLKTRALDLDDLAGLIGAPPDSDETASSQQEAPAESTEDRDTLLPHKPIDFTQLRQLDADVEYRAKDVKAPDLPLNDFALDMTLEDGRMQVDRLDFGVATGTVAMQLEVNAHESPVLAKLQTDFDQVNLSGLLARFDVADNSFGHIGGRGLLWMRGQSLADWFGSADGGLFLTMTGGKVDGMLVELAGLDFSESAAVFLSTDTGVDIECAYTDLQARSGMVTIRPFLLDTTDTKFKGHGTLDLRQEKLDLTVKPYPKDFSILSSRGPLHVNGTFLHPSFSVDPTFPSPEFGTDDDNARCTGIVEGLKKARKKNSEGNTHPS
ncbi:MAG: AsmA family protein [Nitrospirales bacterium]